MFSKRVFSKCAHPDDQAFLRRERVEANARMVKSIDDGWHGMKAANPPYCNNVGALAGKYKK